MQGENTRLYDLVKEAASTLGFADFGVAEACPLPASSRKYYLDAMDEGRFASMAYLGNNIEKRFNPSLLVEGAVSVLVFLVPYSLPGDLAVPAGVAQYALGKDYHQVIKGKLYAIMEMLKGECPNFTGRAFTDSAPVLEREWAVRSGLGFVGKNNFLISKKCGIKNFIGTIICNVDLPSTQEYEPEKFMEASGSCGECSRCIGSCPTGALEGAWRMDARKCISYHTIENRRLGEEILLGRVPDLKGRIFGCDSCMDACPWNSRNVPGWEEFHTNCGLLSEKGYGWWENLQETEFRGLFKDSPLLRGGLENIKESIIWNKKNGYNG